MQTNTSSSNFGILPIGRILIISILLFLCSNVVFAQRVTNINNKGTIFTTGNIVTESATAPTDPTDPTPIQGDFWFDTTNNLLKVWDGTIWKEVVSTVSLEPWFTAGTTTGHTSNTGDMFFSGNIGVGTNTLSAGKVATFAGDVDIQGVLDPTKLIFSGDGSIGSFNPTTDNQYEIEFQEGRDLEIKSNTTSNIIHIKNGGNVGIGTNNPQTSAILDVKDADKGVLLPHVPLTSLTDVTTIPSPAHGLTVFATGGTLEEGYYYYDTDAANAGANASWKKMGSSAAVTPMVFSAEYAGAALYADGADNLGFMTSDNAGASNSWMNFYHWENTETDGGTNDYDIILRFTLPQNFVSWETNAIEIDYAGTADANFTADVYIESNGTAQASLSATAGTGIATWSTATIANTGLTLTAGDTGVIVLHLTATDVATAGASAIRLGDVTLNFKSNN